MKNSTNLEDLSAYEKWYADHKKYSPNRPTAKHGWFAGLKHARSPQKLISLTTDELHLAIQKGIDNWAKSKEGLSVDMHIAMSAIESFVNKNVGQNDRSHETSPPHVQTQHAQENSS